MAEADIAVLLALAAAFFIAVGNVVHQRSAQEVTDERFVGPRSKARVSLVAC